MKKFGTPIGAAPGSASEKVGLSTVGVPSGARPRAGFGTLLRALRLSCAIAFLELRLPARNFWLPLGAVVVPGTVPVLWLGLPPCPGFGLLPGVAVGLGVGVPVTPGIEGTVGTGSCGVACGVGVAIGPLSMTCTITPVMPGMLAAEMEP